MNSTGRRSVNLMVASNTSRKILVNINAIAPEKRGCQVTIFIGFLITYVVGAHSVATDDRL